MYNMRIIKPYIEGTEINSCTQIKEQTKGETL